MYVHFLQSDIVKGEPGVVETFMEMDGDVSRSTPGNGVMSAAGCVGTSMGVG